MSSGSCSCGSGCKCGSGCNCNYPDLSFSEKTSSMTSVAGVAPVKRYSYYEGFEMSFEAENGFKCGSNCNCGSNCSC